MIRYLKSLPVGLWTNSAAMGRYTTEWAKVMTWSGLRRRVGSGFGD